MSHHTKLICLLAIATALLVQPLSAAPPVSRQKTGGRAAASVDMEQYLAVNNTLTFVTNVGQLFRDLNGVFGYDYGYFWPFTGVQNITNGTQTTSPVYAGGLWLGGRVLGQTTVATAEYWTEYVPGPMENGTFLEDHPDFHVYHLYRDSLESNPNSDYLNWPVSQGAPLDQLGKPQLLGDEVLWSVYNDADTALHLNASGSPVPLGVEVQQSVYGSNTGTSDDNCIYVKYKLYNRSGKTITNFYISFWADPDLGGASDDLVGCDTARQLFFVYNGTNSDSKYGTHPPAWGGRLVSGPVVASPGDTAWFDLHRRPGYKNLKISAFERFINGTDPYDYLETYNYMQGLNTDGSPIIGGPIMVPGDPVTGTGVLDIGMADKRMLMTTGPVTFLPGDSQQMVLKFATAQSYDRLNSVSALKQVLMDSAVAPASCDNVTMTSSDFGHLSDVRFEPASQQWVRGIKMGTKYFNGGAGFGKNFFGSSLDPNVTPASFPDVAINFSRGVRQFAYRYVRPTYQYAGYVSVPFTVWDKTHNQQLAVAIVEDSSSRTFDGAWSIDDTAHYGGREYILIFNTPFTVDPSGGPIPYAQKNLKTDAASLPVLYGLWPALVPGHSMNNLADGQRILFDVQNATTNGTHTRLDFGEARIGSKTSVLAKITCSAGTGLPAFYLGVSDSTAFSVADDTLSSDTTTLRGVIAVNEMASPVGPVNPPSGRNVFFETNSTGDYQVVAPGQSLLFLGMDDALQQDWEVRFTDSGSTCYDYNWLGKNPFRVPFEIWNVGDAATNEPSDDRRLVVLLLDNNANGKWDYEERAYAAEQPYQENGPQTLDLGLGTISLRRVMFRDISHLYLAPPVGTIVRYVTAKNSPAGHMPDTSVESGFVGSGFVLNEPSDRMGELSRNVRVTFTPPAHGTTNGYLQVIDSVDQSPVALIVLAGSSEESCCQGTTGDVNGSGVTDLADISTLVAFLTGLTEAPHVSCTDAANISATGIIDLEDLARLVAYLIGESAAPLPNCPALPTQ